MKKIGIMTTGGDCSGLNSVINRVVLGAYNRGWRTFGIIDGTDGLCHMPANAIELTPESLPIENARLAGSFLHNGNSGVMNFETAVKMGRIATFNKNLKKSLAGMGLDAVSVANCAAEHLASLGVSSFAYVGVSGRPFWDAQRETSFVAAMRRRGAAVPVFRPGPGARRGSAALRRFLLALPRPCAVFAAFDAVAKEVVDACAAAGLRVPDDVAVLGCDDDAFICENSYPTISSILPDWQRCGELAVERLLRRIEGGGAGAATKYGVVCVSVRESTRLLSARSAVVKRALAFIAENVTSGISASGVALALDIPLRTLEYRFRRELGRTVSAEIQERRLGAVERMLADRNVRIESIAQMCGYRSDVNLKKQFKKRFGLSMREWRKGVFALA